MQNDEAETDGVTMAMHWIAGVALCVMMLVVVGDVVLRAVFNTPIQGAYDVVSIALLIMTMFGTAPVVAQRGEILIDLIDSFIPRSMRRVLALIAAVGGASVFLFFGWSMIAPAMDAWQWGERSLELGIKKWLLWTAAYVGLVGILWGYFVQLRRVVAGQAGAASEENRS